MRKLAVVIVYIFSFAVLGAPLECRQTLFFERSLSPIKRLDTRSVIKNNFVTSRGLQEYQEGLTQEFIKDLFALSSASTWIDFGAGKALAAEEYLTYLPPSDRSNVLAITYKYNRWFPKYKGPKLKIQKGKFFEELSELPNFNLGSDVYGVFSYTQHLDYYLFLTLKHLEIGGKLYIESNLYQSHIITKNGERKSIAEWMSKLSGISIQVEHGHTLIITKESEKISIPALKIVSISEGLPPRRVFQEIY